MPAQRALRTARRRSSGALATSRAGTFERSADRRTAGFADKADRPARGVEAIPLEPSVATRPPDDSSGETVFDDRALRFRSLTLAEADLSRAGSTRGLSRRLQDPRREARRPAPRGRNARRAALLRARLHDSALGAGSAAVDVHRLRRGRARRHGQRPARLRQGPVGRRALPRARSTRCASAAPGSANSRASPSTRRPPASRCSPACFTPPTCTRR